MSIPGKIRTDYHSKQLKCHDSFNVPAIHSEWWSVIKTPLLTEVDEHFFSFVGINVNCVNLGTFVQG